MTSSLINKGESFMLVKYVDSPKMQYRIAKYANIVGREFSLENPLFIRFHNETAQCKVLMTSNDENELKTVLFDIELDYKIALNKMAKERNSQRSTTTSGLGRVVGKPGMSRFPILCADNYGNRVYILGRNGTEVPENSINVIYWKHYRRATSELLQAVFTDETLATHTLNGKINSTFQLDRRKVEDIVSLVTYWCNAHVDDVYESITQKCYRKKYKLKK